MPLSHSCQWLTSAGAAANAAGRLARSTMPRWALCFRLYSVIKRPAVCQHIGCGERLWQTEALPAACGFLQQPVPAARSALWPCRSHTQFSAAGKKSDTCALQA